MSVIATDSTRFSAVVKHEYEPQTSYCRDVVTMNDAAATIKVGAVLGSFIASPVGTATAAAGNTGTGAMGAITMTSNANLVLGTYKLTIVKAVTDKGDFVLTAPNGAVVGTGQVAAAFSQGGFAFTLADATDYVVGDSFTIAVTGTVKWKLVEATSTDGTEVARAVVIADSAGNSGDTVLVVSTDTKFLALTRGPVIVAASALQFGASVDTAPELAVAYAQLKAVGIEVETAA